jgi:uncharacterized protein YndB with AHSA1/START domain
MEKLFVDRSIKIDAPAQKVWSVLTKDAHTDEWASLFSHGTPQFRIESDWKIGSPVFWKGQDGSIIIEGNVTALEPNKLLRFTVFDVRMEKPSFAEQDGITYELTEHDGTTTLRVLQGDFSGMEEGEKYCRLSGDIWDRVLPKIKEMAER